MDGFKANVNKKVYNFSVGNQISKAKSISNYDRNSYKGITGKPQAFIVPVELGEVLDRICLPPRRKEAHLIIIIIGSLFWILIFQVIFTE